MDSIIMIAKVLLIFFPVILWGILVWRVEKWDRKYKSMDAETLRNSGYYRKKRLLYFLLWVSSFLAMITLLTLFMKIGLGR